MNEDLELNVDCSIISTKTKLTPKRKTTKLQYCLSEKEKKNFIKKLKLEEDQKQPKSNTTNKKVKKQ
jgi:hypothetical protein